MSKSKSKCQSQPDSSELDDGDKAFLFLSDRGETNCAQQNVISMTKKGAGECDVQHATCAGEGVRLKGIRSTA